MAGNDVKVGSAFIELEARNQKLLSDIRQAADRTSSAGEDAGRKWSTGFAVAAGALAATGLAKAAELGTAAFTKALDNSAANSKLKAQLALSDADAKRLGGIAGQLYGQAYGDSLGSVNEAIRNLVQSGVTSLKAPNGEIQALTKNALDLAEAFDVEVTESAAAAGQMMKTGLAKNGREAFDLITVAFQKFGKNGDDVLDSLTEYGVQFEKLGLDGKTTLGLINQMMLAGARNTDFASDALKEFSIRAVDGSKSTADGFRALGLNADTMAAKFGKGGKSASDALALTLDRLKAIPDPVARSQAAYALFGTKSEDLGKSLLAMDPSTAVASLGQVGGAADRMGTALNDNAKVKLDSFKRSLETWATGKAAKAIPLLRGIADAASHVPGPVQTGALALVGLALVARPAKAALDGVTGAAKGVAGAGRAVVTGARTTATGVGQLVSGFRSAQAAESAFSGRMGTLGGKLRTAGDSAARFGSRVASSTASGLTRFGTALASAGRAAVTFAATCARAAGAAIASAARMAASIAATAVRVVASWVVMATQSLIQAARMAAAWFIALGPIGWITAAVVAIVVLIVANWDKVKRWTAAVWDWIWNKVKAVTGFLVGLFLKWHPIGIIISHWGAIQRAAGAAWDWIWNKVKAVTGFLVGLFLKYHPAGIIISHWRAIQRAAGQAWDWIWGKIQWFTRTLVSLFLRFHPVGLLIANFGRLRDGVVDKLTALVSWLRSLPGKIVSALGNLGSLLYSKGRDILQGLWNGMLSMAGWLKDKIKGLIKSALDKLNPFSLLSTDTPPGGGTGLPAAPSGGRSVSTLTDPGPLARTVTAGPVTNPLEEVRSAITEGFSDPFAAFDFDLDRALRGRVREPKASPDSAAVGGVVVNVHSQADPYEIGKALAWELRTAGR